jgi:hypothetical protein
MSQICCPSPLQAKLKGLPSFLSSLSCWQWRLLPSAAGNANRWAEARKENMPADCTCGAKLQTEDEIKNHLLENKNQMWHFIGQRYKIIGYVRPTPVAADLRHALDGVSVPENPDNSKDGASR